MCASLCDWIYVVFVCEVSLWMCVWMHTHVIVCMVMCLNKYAHALCVCLCIENKYTDGGNWLDLLGVRTMYILVLYKWWQWWVTTLLEIGKHFDCHVTEYCTVFSDAEEWIFIIVNRIIERGCTYRAAGHQVPSVVHFLDVAVHSVTNLTSCSPSQSE